MLPIVKEECDLFEKAHIWNGLPAPCTVLEETGSVLDDAWALVGQNKFPTWASVLAYSQNAGRGQTRRQWQSPVGNLYVALRLPNIAPFNDTCAAPALSSLIIKALNYIDCSLHLKWPNDLVNAKKLQKVGGILLEEKQGVIIAGIGINVDSAPSMQFMREQSALAAGTLPHVSSIENKLIQQDSMDFTYVMPLPERLWLYLVRKMYFCYNYKLAQEWDKAWQVEANQSLLWKGQSVCLYDGIKKICGTLNALGSAGELELVVAGQKQYFLNGSLNSF